MVMTAAVALNGCAAIPPINPGQPRNEPVYPIVFASNAERIKAVTTAWKQMLALQHVSSNDEPVLQPATATIKALPQSLATGVYLTRIGVANDA